MTRFEQQVCEYLRPNYPPEVVLPAIQAIKRQGRYYKDAYDFAMVVWNYLVQSDPRIYKMDDDMAGWFSKHVRESCSRELSRRYYEEEAALAHVAAVERIMPYSRLQEIVSIQEVTIRTLLDIIFEMENEST